MSDSGAVRQFAAAAGLLLFFAGPCTGQSPSARAGEVRAVLPVGRILRDGAPPKDAQRDDPVFWQDIAQTARSGRLRIGLLDGSILNVGSESQMQILQHDPQTQNTAIELAYGRLRARVVRLARPRANFEVRTPVAVTGVVGTGLVIRIFADFTEVLCLEDSVRVRNRDDMIRGEVILLPGEFTRVARAAPPTPPAKASPEQLREALEETDIPARGVAWSRAEVSWPPAECGEGAELRVRAWSKQIQNNKEVESPVDPELVSGTMRLGPQVIRVEASLANQGALRTREPPEGAFTPAGAAEPLPTKIWRALKWEEGEGWRVARAVPVGSAFYVLGPMGKTGRPTFSFGQQPAELLWQSPCGAGFLAPRLPGSEYEVTLAIDGQPVARGKMNLIEMSYELPNPPAVLRGQSISFGINVRGLGGLDRFTQGRPAIITVVRNQTPQIIGNLGSNTPGAKASGETITYAIGGGNISSAGTIRLDGSARGRQAGTFVLGIETRLDEALERPRNPLAPAAPVR